MTYARATDPDTSHAAAESLDAARVRQSQQLVLQIVTEFGPITDTHVAEMYNRRYAIAHPQSPSGLRTRRKELVAAGAVKDSGMRETLQSGRKSICWDVR